MLIEESYDTTHIKHYSDDNKFIIQNETNELYTEAVDVLPCRFTYTETDIDIITIDESDITEDSQNTDDELNDPNIDYDFDYLPDDDI